MQLRFPASAQFQGPPGPPGPPGEPFAVDVVGPESERANYTTDENVRSYLSEDTGLLWVKRPDGSWSADGIPFRGDEGPEGPAGPPGAPGQNGQDGRSAYQVWLDAGNTGTQSDFLAAMRGEPGDAGPVGDSAYQVAVSEGFMGTKEEWLESLIGPPGEKGDPGEGLKVLGTLGDTSELPGSASAGDAYLIASDLHVWSGSEWVNAGPVRGPQGDLGPPGPPGDAGPPGDDAYEVAVSEGFVGTRAQWLESLQGPEGEAGQTGPQGPPGTTSWSGITDKPATFPPVIGSQENQAVAGTHAGAGGSAHAAATTSAAGFMVAEDKAKLDSLGVLLTNYPSLQAALDATPSGGALIVPPGTHTVSPATMNDKDISILGYGAGVSILLFTSGAGGITANYTRVDGRITVSDLSLWTTQANAGTALRTTWPSASSNPFPRGLFRNLDIRGENHSTQNWTKGIHATDCWTSTIENVRFLGLSGNIASSTHVIHLDGRSIEVNIDKVMCRWANIGIGITEESEGPTITNFNLVNVNIGILLTSPTERPYCGIGPGHISAYVTGIECSRRTQGVIQGVLIYKRPDATTNFNGIRLLDNSNRMRVVASEVSGAGASGTQNGVNVASGTHCIVANNNFHGSTNGVVLSASSQSCVAIGNIRSGGTTTVNNAGTGNVVVNNI